jgi:predicted MFS family arabinose efflux permease
LLNAAAGILAVSFFGIQMLLKVLYLLRLGYGLEYIGVFSAIGAMAYMTMSLPSGALGGRLGTRKTMLTGGATAMVGMAILPLVEVLPPWSQNAWPILSQVVLIGGWAMFSVNLVPALMATTSAQNRNTAFAFSSMVRGFGTLVGTLIGGVLPSFFVAIAGGSLDDPAPYRYALWTSAFLALLGLIPLVLLRSIGPATTGTRVRAKGPFPVWPILLIALYTFFTQGGSATCGAFCNAYFDTEFHMSAATIGFITGAGQLLAVFAPLMVPRMAALHSGAWALSSTSVGIAISLLPLALIPSGFAAGLGRVGLLALAAVWLPVLQVYQMELIEDARRSLAYGIFSAVMGFGFASMSFAGGYIVEELGYQTLFLLGTGMALLGAALMAAVNKRPQIGRAPQIKTKPG